MDQSSDATTVGADVWGRFLAPRSVSGGDDLHEAMGIPIPSGFRADLTAFRDTQRVFDQIRHSGGRVFDHIAETISGSSIVCEDQCSAKHYFDIFTCLYNSHRAVSRVVDVGVFMGGSASIFAGCVEPLELELDLVDVNTTYLRFTYERLRRLFPAAMPKVRMFYGDLPTYVRNVLLSEDGVTGWIHHDGSHHFAQVVKDLSALYFARDRVHGVAVQDTHLRGRDLSFLNFVDAAVYAVFGVDLHYTPLGSSFEATSPLVHPNQYEGNYFMPEAPEGMYIPLAKNTFKYPHPTMSIEDIISA